MKKIEQTCRELLWQWIEKENFIATQKGIATKLGISLSTVNYALKPLRRMNAIKVNPRNLKIINAKKILYYWASLRNIYKDIIYETRVEESVKDIEKKMPANTIYTAYSGYKYKFNEVPADYSEVYVYASDLAEIKKRFPFNKNPPNLFALKADGNIEKYGKTATIANIFVDLWNLKEWYAIDFLKALEARLNEIFK